MNGQKFKSTIAICAMFAALVLIGAAFSDGGNTVYGAESGRCDVYNGTKKLHEAMDIRAAWELCKENYNYTIVLTSDVKLDKKLETHGVSGEDKITIDLNGYSIDCQNKDGAFKLHKYDTIKICNSKYGTKESAIRNCKNSAVVSYGILYVQGITIENCTGSNGGAINVVASRSRFFSLNDPHADIKDCTIRNCRAEKGGAIYSTILKLGAEGEITDQYEDIDEYIESNAGFGAVLNISNTNISYCTAKDGNYGYGGGISFQGECTIQDSSIEHCYGEGGAGGIHVGYGATLTMRNTKVNYNKANDGPGGGIFIPDSKGGEDPKSPGKATITGGEIIGNEGDYAGGIYMSNVHGGAELTIGGELVVKDNIDTSKKQRNIELTKDHIVYLTAEGLTGKAEVGIGTGKKGDEVVIGNASNPTIAEQSASHMFADHKNSEEAQGDDNLGIYTYSGSNEILMGKSRKMELISFKLTGEDRANVNVTIDNEKKTITAKFPFKEGYWNELWEAEWYAGTPGSSSEGRVYTQGDHEGSQVHPLKSGTATRGDYKEVDQDYIMLKRNNGVKSWKIIFINDPNSMGRVIVENGIVKDKNAEKTSTDKKKIYYLSANTTVQLKADAAPEGRAFDYWELGSETTADTMFSDWNNPNANVYVLGNDKTIHLIAHYTAKKKVTVINGTLENGRTEGYFAPGEEVKVKANDSGKFSSWTVVSGYAELEAGASKKASSSFKMGTNIPTKSKYNYTDVVIKATDLSIEEPTTSLKAGEYTGNQKTKLACATKNAVIYYSMDSKSYVKYNGENIELTVGKWEQSKRHVIKAYSVLYDSEGKELIRSETVSFEYTIYNTTPIERRTLIVYGGGILEKGGVSKIILNPGENVTAVASDTSKNFQYWEVLSGSLVLTESQKRLPAVNFTMPNSDVVLLAHYSVDPYDKHTATAVGGTVNGMTSVKAAGGETLALTAFASENHDGVLWKFEKWTVTTKDGVIVHTSTNPIDSFTMPDEYVTAVASYKKVASHTVKVLNGYLDKTKSKRMWEYTPGSTVTATCSKGGWLYEFDHWEVTGKLTLTDAQKKSKEITFTMPDDDIVLKAVVKKKPKTYGVTVVNGKHVAQGTTYERYAAGSAVSVVADVDTDDRKFVRWEGIGVSPSQPTLRNWNFTMPAQVVVATARFADIHVATINGGNRAAYTTSTFVAKGLYEFDQAVEISANIPEGYEFNKWEIMLAPYGFTMTDLQKTSANTIIKTKPRGNIVLEATFTKKCSYSGDKCTISVNGGTAGTSGYAKEGDTLTVTADKIDGATLVGWQAVGVTLPSDVGTKSSFTVTMPNNDVSIKAIFTSDPTTLYTLNVEQGHIGSEVSRTCGVYGEGTEISVTADNPAPEGMTSIYTFKEWQVVEGPEGLLDGQKTSETVTFNMPAQNVKLKAVYSHTVTGAAIHGRLTKNSSLLASSVEENLTPGESVTATPSVGTGMTFDHWDAYGVDLTGITPEADGSVTFAVPNNNFVLVAIFKETPVTKNTLVTQNGTNKTKGSSETPATTGTYASGTEVTIKAVNPGEATGESSKYQFTGWEVIQGPDGFTVKHADAEQTITMPNDDVVLRANYKEVTYNYTGINCTIKAGSGEYKKSGKASEGTAMHVKLTEYEGVNFDHWEVNGVERTDLGKATTFDIDMPAEDLIVKAVYTDGPSVNTLDVINGYIGTDESRATGAYGEGTELTVTAKNLTPDTNSYYVFKEWQIVKGPEDLLDGQKTSETVTFKMPAQDVELKAVYELRVNATVIHGSLDKGTSGLKPGDTVTATASPGVGITFTHWIAIGADIPTGKSSDRSITLTVPNNDFTLVACYKQSPVTVYTLMTENGTNVTKGSGETPAKIGTYGSGTEVTIKAVNPGTATGEEDYYRFVKWEIVQAPDDFAINVNEDGEQTIIMPEDDVVLRAVYKEKHEVVGLHGNVTVQEANAGTSQLLTAANISTIETACEGDNLVVEADLGAGMTFDHWEASGLWLTDEQKYNEKFTATMPDNDVIFVAVYKESPIPVHNLSTINAYIVGVDESDKRSKDFYMGSTICVSADAKAGYEFKCWKAEGIELTEEQRTSADIEIIMSGNDVTLTAEYVAKGGTDTGDSNNIIFYAGLAILSIIRAVKMLWKRRLMI